MKKILILIIVVLASALYFHDELKQIISPPEVTVKNKDLILRDGLTYQKFSQVPFTGKVTEKAQGSFKNGKKEGYWESHDFNGKADGFSGTYKNGKREGSWVVYYSSGNINQKYAGTYKNDVKIDERWDEKILRDD